ncbi:MAG: hypothetical protein A2W93_00360 [Bacteroidetes bacterium GWF2_43_63]|nr:MAG: hypothetical protein A2W94_13160 [Bacteroidetes bacterium GWE2_42_42]OFY53858.1 MAG: hypothetical protein A2W93_00360 [Bacteroidetes bacterium GWF2_43_63]HBG69816.1 hypothetical protein [Bacteroidales bacterium]HCB60986.1 hypothetical protein [Bacteroidales bacterium]HCY24542.1 hypothetical protein [Bacteroidales bacterium]
MDIQQLNDFFSEHKIPVSKETVGFLEIIGKQHHENINSAIYAHFINSGNDEVRNLFLDTLLELVDKKSGKSLSLRQAFAQTEVNTGQGRIDIVISDQTSDNFIVVENKIYHCLFNDLMDYWRFIKQSESQKVGVLLTLHPHSIPEPVKGKFINITHLEWIKLIETRFNPEVLSEKYRVYITDFIATIELLTKEYKMNESVKFYFQNAEKVLQANATMDHAHRFIDNQLEIIAGNIGWQTYGNSMGWRNLWDGKNKLDTYLTILTKDLLEGKLAFTIILELNEKDVKHASELQTMLINHPQVKDKKWGPQIGKYMHLLCKCYDISEDELENLADFVVRKIHEDFAEITHAAIKFIYPNTDISSWEKQFLGK